MELRLRVVEGTKQLTLLEAMSTGRIILEEDRLYSDTAKILRSTSLWDLDEHEIFEEDMVVDEQGHMYSITYKNGAFFAVSHSQDVPRMIPLYLLQGSDHIPIKISKIRL